MPVTTPLEDTEEFEATGVFKVGENARANVERLLGGFEKPLIQGPHLTTQLEKLHVGYQIDQGLIGDKEDEALPKLLANASHFQGPHADLTNGIAQASGGQAHVAEDLKKKHRIKEKCLERGYTHNMIGDVVRSRIHFNDLESLYLAVIELYKRAEIVRVKDRFVSPRQSGYRDLLFNVKLKDPETGEYHITEIQFQLEDMHKAKRSEYSYYIKRRSLQEKIARCRNEEPDNHEKIKELETKISYLLRTSQDIYDTAWEPYEGKFDGYEKMAEEAAA